MFVLNKHDFIASAKRAILQLVSASSIWDEQFNYFFHVVFLSGLWPVNFGIGDGSRRPRYILSRLGVDVDVEIRVEVVNHGIRFVVPVS